MGSNGDVIPPQEDEITVLITGFGPFRAQNPLNPSWEIAKSLPPFLPPSKSSSNSKLFSHPPVRILVHPDAIRVAYKAVRELIPKLWEGQKIDYAIHIGMASGRKYYSIERRGHRDGYGMRDVDNQLLGDYERRKEEGEDWIWYGLPEELVTCLDVDDVWKRWRVALPSVDARVSEDAGRYLCDFIYYSSLAELTKRCEERRVLFFHVPVDCDDAHIEKGVEITSELIRAMVQSERLKKMVSQ